MTHFSMLVCLPGMPTDAVRAAITAAMQPYGVGPDDGIGEWDSWRIEGDFLVRPQFDTDPR
jgi:hypothetical protein